MKTNLIDDAICLFRAGLASCSNAAYWKKALLCPALTGAVTGCKLGMTVPEATTVVLPAINDDETFEVRVKAAINENIFAKIQIKQNGNNRN
jgi:hypothetical protein